MSFSSFVYLFSGLLFSCLLISCKKADRPEVESIGLPTDTATLLVKTPPQPDSIASLTGSSTIKDSLLPPKTYDYDTSQWTEITLVETDIRLDLRYATDSNFMKQKIYDCGRCFYRKPVAAALLKVQAELAEKGLGLKMFDCYRPAPYQQRLWDILPDARYVARPSKGSLHSRGAAADLTVVNLKTGAELDMGTGYDFFGEEAYTTTTDLPQEVLDNRALFQEVMRKYGFGTIRTEWWHFNFLGPRLELADWVWDCEGIKD